MVAHGRTAVLYDPAAQLAFQREIIHSSSGLVPFIRPPFYALAVAPLGMLPYGTAFVVWISMQVLLLIGCWVWAASRFGPVAAVIGSLFMPAALGIAHGQDCALPLALLIGSYALAERQRLAASGLVVGGMLIKFHLILLWPLGLMLRRQWRMLGGFFAAAAILATICLAMVGFPGLGSYFLLLRNPSLENLSPSPEYMISIPGLLANLGLDSTVMVAALTGLVIAVWAWTVRRAAQAQMYAVTSVACLLMVGHVYGYDASILLLSVWLTLCLPAKRPARMGALWVAMPLAFGFGPAGKPWAAIASLSLLVFLMLLAAGAMVGGEESAPERAFEPATRRRSLPTAPHSFSN